MPDVRTVVNFDGLSPAELEQKRREFQILAESKGGADHLSEAELYEWLAITRELRKGKAGPAKKPKKSKGEPMTSADLF